MSLKRLAASLTVTLLALLHVHAQSNSSAGPTHTAEEREQRKNILEKSLRLLDGVVADARSLRLAENRILVRAAAADLLWDYDKKRARSLFAEALSDLDEMKATLNYENPPDDNLMESYAGLRQTMLKIVARRDPSSARDFLRATSIATQPDDELRLSLDLASQMAASDPQQSLHIAQETLKQGLSDQLIDLVSSLRESNPDAASQLTGSIIARLRSEDLAHNENAASMARTLLLFNARSRNSLSLKGAAEAGDSIKPSDYDELIRLVATAALRNPAETDLLYTLQPLMPEVENHAPSLAPQLQRRLVQLTRASRNQTQNEAEEADSVGSTIIVGGHRLSRQERAVELAGRAALLTNKGETVQALELLTEAQGLLGAGAKNYAELEAQVHIARTYAALDQRRSFELIEALVYQLNTLADAVATVDGFVIEGQYTRDDEFLLKPLAGSVNRVAGENDGALARLADADFDRLLLLAGGLKRPEVRILANLLIAQSVLSEQASTEKKSKTVGSS